MLCNVIFIQSTPKSELEKNDIDMDSNASPESILWTKIKSPHPNMYNPKSWPKYIHHQKMLNIYDLCMKVMDRTRTWIYRAHAVDAAQLLGPYPIVWWEVGHTFSKFLENNKRSNIGAYFHTIQSSYCSCRSSSSVVIHTYHTFYHIHVEIQRNNNNNDNKIRYNMV